MKDLEKEYVFGFMEGQLVLCFRHADQILLPLFSLSRQMERPNLLAMQFNDDRVLIHEVNSGVSGSVAISSKFMIYFRLQKTAEQVALKAQRLCTVTQMKGPFPKSKLFRTMKAFTAINYHCRMYSKLILVTHIPQYIGDSQACFQSLCH
jgi:hypothetical protein